MRKTIAALVAAAAASILFAGDFWAEKPYTEWTEKEVIKLLGSSPWADVQIFREEGPIELGRSSRSGQPNIQQPGNPASPDRPSGPAREYAVRFWSAAPVRMAWGQLALLKGTAQAEDVQRYVEAVPFEGKIVIGLMASPTRESQKLEEMTLESFGEETYLELKSHKQKIFPTQYVKPSEFGSGAVFVFPREVEGQSIDWSQEKEIRFRCEIDKETRLDEKFKIKDMSFKGRVEL